MLVVGEKLIGNMSCYSSLDLYIGNTDLNIYSVCVVYFDEVVRLIG